MPGQVKVWNGTGWVPKPVKVWNGTAWVAKPVKRWNGTAWVAVTDGVTVNPPTAYRYRRGVAFAGGNYSNHFYPTQLGAQQMAARGIKIGRQTTKWEYLQPTLGAPLNATEIGKLRTSLDYMAAAGIGIIIEPHNYGRYATSDGVTHILGDATLTNARFADFWTRLVTALADHPAIYGWELMNEPHDLPGGAPAWQVASQAAVDAIRAVDPDRMIWIPTYEWQSVSRNFVNHPSGPWISNGGLLKYAAHQYLDWDGSGKYTSSYTADNSSAVAAGYTNLRARQASRIKSFTDWLTQFGADGVISEVGWPFGAWAGFNDQAAWQADGEVLYQQYDAANLDVTYWFSGSYSSGTPGSATAAYNYYPGVATPVYPPATVIEAHPSVVAP